MTDFHIPESAFRGPSVSTRPISNGPTGGLGDPPPSRRERHFAERSGGKRLDVQGLRAVAVITVVINHLTGHPRGGFVGVDVFFVISGYLITSHLVRDLGRQVDGKPQGFLSYLGGFYRRRVRRLFPAALLVLMLTVVAAKTTLGPTRFTSTWHDALYAAGFVANWHFYAQGTNYFTAGLPDSPFQHYWSLSVEEQFYVVWPLVLFALGVALVARRTDALQRRRAAGAVAAGLLVTGSLGYAFFESSTQPIAAYFSTWSRGWELGLGGLLACLVPSLRASTRTLTAMSWTGLGLIVVSLFTAQGGHGFPAPGAILPCLGAALVIGATSRGRRAANIALTNRVSVFVGDISYSLYLVHFPVIILLAEWMNHRGGYFYAAGALAAFGISVAIYTFVERPVLASTWLLPRNASRPEVADNTVPARHLALLAAVTVTAGLIAVSLWPGEGAANVAKQEQIQAALSNAPSVSAGASGPARPALPPKAGALQVQLKSALGAGVWPTLHPSYDQAVSGPEAPGDIESCTSITLQPAAKCTWGHGSKIAYVVGDSTSMVYMQAYRDMVNGSLAGWSIRYLGAVGCNFDTVVIHNDNTNIQNNCARHNAEVVSAIHGARPDVVLLTNTYAPRPAASTNRDLTDQQWTTAVGDELAKISGSVGKVVDVAPPPDGGNPAGCHTANSSPTSCVYQVPATWTSRRDSEAALAARNHDVFIDAVSWFCVSGYCPAFAGDVPTKHDNIHATSYYMDKIWPVMLEALVAAKVTS